MSGCERGECGTLTPEVLELLQEAQEALINRDAVECYKSGHDPCRCTLCRINDVMDGINAES